MKRNAIALMSLMLAAHIGFSSVAKAAPPGLPCAEESDDIDVHSKKQMLKTFTPYFWRTIEKKASVYPLALQRKGVVVGDFHFANLGIYFDYALGRAELTVNDLDDAGTNYLIGDLDKYLLYLKKLDKDLDLSEVLDAYASGLQKNLRPAPSELQDLLSWKAAQFEKKRYKFIKNRRDDAIEFNASDLNKHQRETFAVLERLQLFQQMTNIQKWIQTNETGSSAGMDRYLFMGTYRESGVDGIVEFKTLKCSATGDPKRQDLITNQKNVVTYLSNIMGVKEETSLLGRQRVLQIMDQYLQFREKQPNAINDLEIEKMGTKSLQKYAQFYASYLGWVHSGSADAAYVNAIKSNKEFILSELKPIFADFKKRTENEN
jgi:hypothetical protein